VSLRNRSTLTHLVSYRPLRCVAYYTVHFVYLSSVHEHISKTRCPNFSKLSVHVACGRGSVVDCGVVTYFRFCHVSHNGPIYIWRVALEIMDVGAVLPEVVRNFQRIRQGALRCLTMPWQYAAAAYGRTQTDFDNWSEVCCLRLPCYYWPHRMHSIDAAYCSR